MFGRSALLVVNETAYAATSPAVSGEILTTLGSEERACLTYSSDGSEMICKPSFPSATSARFPAAATSTASPGVSTTPTRVPGESGASLPVSGSGERAMMDSPSAPSAMSASPPNTSIASAEPGVFVDTDPRTGSSAGLGLRRIMLKPWLAPSATNSRSSKAKTSFASPDVVIVFGGGAEEDRGFSMGTEAEYTSASMSPSATLKTTFSKRIARLDNSSTVFGRETNGIASTSSKAGA